LTRPLLPVGLLIPIADIFRVPTQHLPIRPHPVVPNRLDGVTATAFEASKFANRSLIPSEIRSKNPYDLGGYKEQSDSLYYVPNIAILPDLTLT